MTDSPKTDINRIKVVLVEQKRTAKGLAEQLHKDQMVYKLRSTRVRNPFADSKDSRC